ncbi:MAG: HEAT repeat domain-containing protein [Cyclobacteriaceae bacterium]
MKIENDSMAKALWLDSLEGELSFEQEKALQQYLSAHSELEEELKASTKIWDALDMPIAPPSHRMDERFYEMLSSHSTSLRNQFSRVWMMAASISILIIGFASGWWISSPRQQSMAELTNQVAQLQEVMMLTLIEQPKAQDRLKAVNITYELSDADETIISALVKTLKMDDNVNVRLAALDALSAKVENPRVRAELIEAIAYQDNPMVQIAIAELMVQIEESGAKKELEALINSPDINPFAKERITQSIKSI